MSHDDHGGLLLSPLDRRSEEGRTSAVTEPRVAAFCDPTGPEVFHSVAHRHEIWRADPFDVGEIHEEARATFERLLHRATTPPGLAAGRILLLKGESGSGKTHLMRVFRNYVHARRLGYCAYLQMTTSSRQYDRYVLSNLIDALDQPYYESQTETSGLMCLSDALIETPSAIINRERQKLRDEDLSDTELAVFVAELADQIRDDERYTDIDVHLIQALLYLQRKEPRINARVLSYLRCEDLSAYDRNLLGGIIPRTEADRTIEALGRLMWRLQQVSLVVCIDQLEDMYNLDDAQEQFRRAMQTLCALADRVPSSIWVISCLEDYYEQLRGRLTRPLLDRIEAADPKPLRLESRRSTEEIGALVSRRLQVLFELTEAPVDPRHSTFPFMPDQLTSLTNVRTRDVLDWCREYQRRCMQVGRLVDVPERDGLDRPSVDRPAEAATDPQASIALEQAWNDFRAAHTQPPPESDRELTELLGWAVAQCGDEIETGHRFSATADDWLLAIEVENAADTSVELLQVGLCNKDARGGGLARQVNDLEARAGEHTPILVRSTDFPKSPKAQVVLQIGRLLARGGRRVVVEDSDWRTMHALRSFREQHVARAGFDQWLCMERPLSRLKCLRDLLALDSLISARRPAASRPEEPLAPPPRNAPAATPTGDAEPSPAVAGDHICIGRTRSRRPEPVTLAPRDLTMHAAFLGGSGSGKTTLALGLLEQLLHRDVPVVLLDRKGDLCGYAADEFWTAELPDAELTRRRDRLRSRLDVQVYTPGNPHGNPLSIPLVPEGLAELSSFERDQTAQYAAAALAGMMGLKQTATDQPRIAVLGQALRLLAELEPDVAPTLHDLIEFIAERDPRLIAAVGRLDAKHFDKLTEHLATLRLTRGALLAADGAALDVGGLLGEPRTAGRARLSIISTKFLGDNASIEFWVAQFLMAVGRWASRHPSSHLQAALLLDEADMYLPAQRQPATKGPMEDLLKRARSAGIALFLATQSPGDFDYKCRDTIRTWLVGRVKEKTALDKLRPMLAESRDGVADRIPAQTTGQFHLLCDGTATALDSDRSLLHTRQFSEDEILRLAAGSRER